MFRTKHIILSFFLICYVHTLISQLPVSNIFLFEIEDSEGAINLKSSKYLTAFNSKGYNCTPSFIDKSNFLISSNYYTPSQTEIIHLSLDNKELYRLTRSQNSISTPSFNKSNKLISLLKSSDEGKNNLHSFNRDANKMSESYFDNSYNVVNYIEDSNGILYLAIKYQNGETSLAVADPSKKKIIPIVENITHCLKLSKNGELFFIHKLNPDSWYIKSYNSSSKTLTKHVKTLKGKDNFDLYKSSIIAGSGSLLYQYELNSQESWSIFLDLSIYEIKNISGLELFDNQLLLTDKSVR